MKWIPLNKFAGLIQKIDRFYQEALALSFEKTAAAEDTEEIENILRDIEAAAQQEELTDEQNEEIRAALSIFQISATNSKALFTGSETLKNLKASFNHFPALADVIQDAINFINMIAQRDGVNLTKPDSPDDRIFLRTEIDKLRRMEAGVLEEQETAGDPQVKGWLASLKQIEGTGIDDIIAETRNIVFLYEEVMRIGSGHKYVVDEINKMEALFDYTEAEEGGNESIETIDEVTNSILSNLGKAGKAKLREQTPVDVIRHLEQISKKNMTNYSEEPENDNTGMEGLEGAPEEESTTLPEDDPSKIMPTPEGTTQFDPTAGIGGEKGDKVNRGYRFAPLSRTDWIKRVQDEVTKYQLLQEATVAREPQTKANFDKIFDLLRSKMKQTERKFELIGQIAAIGKEHAGSLPERTELERVEGNLDKINGEIRSKKQMIKWKRAPIEIENLKYKMPALDDFDRLTATLEADLFKTQGMRRYVNRGEKLDKLKKLIKNLYGMKNKTPGVPILSDEDIRKQISEIAEAGKKITRPTEEQQKDAARYRGTILGIATRIYQRFNEFRSEVRGKNMFPEISFKYMMENNEEYRAFWLKILTTKQKIEQLEKEVDKAKKLNSPNLAQLQDTLTLVKKQLSALHKEQRELIKRNIYRDIFSSKERGKILGFMFHTSIEGTNLFFSITNAIKDGALGPGIEGIKSKDEDKREEYKDILPIYLDNSEELPNKIQLFIPNATSKDLIEKLNEFNPQFKAFVIEPVVLAETEAKPEIE